MNIKISELKCLCEKILEKAEKSGITEVSVDIDYYLDVNYEDRYNLNIETPEVVTGSFLDDWDWLKKILTEENPPIIVDFDRLGNVLKAIGDAIHKSDKIY